jgi:hypothetical protein
MKKHLALALTILASCAQSKPLVYEPTEPRPSTEQTTQSATENEVQDAGLPEIVAPPPAYGNKVVRRRAPKRAPKALPGGPGQR